MSDHSQSAYQYMDLCIPVEVKPDAVIGEIKAECCGRPLIDCRENLLRRTCEITIEQRVRIRIPIKYTATANVGNVEIECGRECGCT